MLFLFTHYYSYQFILNTMMGYTFIKLNRSTRFLYPTICSRLICYGLFFQCSCISPVLSLHCLCFGLFFSTFIYSARFFMYPPSFIFKMGEFLHLTSKQPSFFHFHGLFKVFPTDFRPF